MSDLSHHSILADGKLIGDNFLDHYRNLKIVLQQEKLIYTIEKRNVPKPKDKDDAEPSSTYKKYLRIARIPNASSKHQ